ncbi:hypothetical protein J437_LFUL005258 [Ladona fulva]|uniref:Uncharacterized protein n=1 Tax=Ladona fulva TaxID=123851 RepID=A0A8K0NSV6_LADFU|nr:hypothetical protein J437_LFUL005258 [Ladona fulva]
MDDSTNILELPTAYSCDEFIVNHPGSAFAIEDAADFEPSRTTDILVQDSQPKDSPAETKLKQNIANGNSTFLWKKYERAAQQLSERKIALLKKLVNCQPLKLRGQHLRNRYIQTTQLKIASENDIAEANAARARELVA